VFEIALVNNGRTQQHQVYATMPVSQLVVEAARIFSLNPARLILTLASAAPETLDRGATLQEPPRVCPHATVFVFVAEVFPEDNRFAGHEGSAQGEHHQITVAVPRMHSKLLGTFKLPKFDGTPRAWKQWDRDFIRFLGLHQLEHVLLEGFLLLLPHPDAVAANKIVYFLVEEAILPGTLASKYVRQAALWDGHGAYVLMYNGFVFSGPQTATVLMAELSNMRFQSEETGTAFCLRLIEVLEDLEHIPGTAAVVLNDTQKLGYLLSAIRHERDLGGVYVQLQNDQLRGKVTFEQACQDVHFRCEAIRADALLDSRFKPTGKVLISTEIKHLDKEKLPCLAKGCEGMIVAFLPLCKGCFLQCKSGKVATLELRDGLGSTKYNVTTAKLEFPPGVPKSRLPGNRPRKEVRKGLMFHVAGGKQGPEVSSLQVGEFPAVEVLTNGVIEESQGTQGVDHDEEEFVGHSVPIIRSYNGSLRSMRGIGALFSGKESSGETSVKCLAVGHSSRVTFFVDSGAGECLCSVSGAFSDLQPCRIDICEGLGALMKVINVHCTYEH
jgi:hypothetical protein